MIISGSQFNPGHINSHKNRKSLPDNREAPQQEEKNYSKHDLDKSKEISADIFQQKQNAYKIKSSYMNQKALNQYHLFNNLEKREFAEAALGISVYA